MTMSLSSHNVWPTLYNNKNQCHNWKQHQSFSCNTTHWSQSLRCTQVMNCKGYVVSRQDTNRNNTKCTLSVRCHYNTTPVTPCSTEHFLKCIITALLRLYSRSYKPHENCLYTVFWMYWMMYCYTETLWTFTTNQGLKNSEISKHVHV